MKNILVIIALLALAVSFVLSSAAFAYVAIFWFRADWFQVFVLLVLCLAAYGFWQALGMVASWGSK